MYRSRFPTLLSAACLATLTTAMAIVPGSALARGHRTNPGAFVHDGFYFRAGLGIGGITANPVYDGEVQPDISVHGSGIAAEVMVGGSLAPGVVLGGAFFYQQAFKPKYTVDTVTYQPDSDKSLNFTFFGPFIDWYPNPGRGFHVGGFVGFSRLKMTNPAGDTTSYSPLGGAAGLMIGHDFWLAPDFSLGLSLHLAGGEVSGTPESQGKSDPHVSTSFGVAQFFVSVVFN